MILSPASMNERFFLPAHKDLEASTLFDFEASSPYGIEANTLHRFENNV